LSFFAGFSRAKGCTSGAKAGFPATNGKTPVEVTMPKKISEIPVPPELQEAIDQLVAAPRCQVPKGLINELRQYLAVHQLLPEHLHLNEKPAVDQAQEALVQLEARFDRVVAIHFDAKFTLQRFVQLETLLLRAMEQLGLIQGKMARHQQELNCRTAAPQFFNLRARWEMVASLCGDVQRRLETARDTLKLMQKLDDHLQWALHRNP
jgi:hypothetical protein